MHISKRLGEKSGITGYAGKCEYRYWYRLIGDHMYEFYWFSDTGWSGIDVWQQPRDNHLHRFRKGDEDDA